MGGASDFLAGGRMPGGFCGAFGLGGVLRFAQDDRSFGVRLGTASDELHPRRLQSVILCGVHVERSGAFTESKNPLGLVAFVMLRGVLTMSQASGECLAAFVVVPDRTESFASLKMTEYFLLFICISLIYLSSIHHSWTLP